MKRLPLLTLLLLSFCSTRISLGQNKGNPHFFKLLVTNEADQVLLIEWDGAWELPGARYTTLQSLSVFLDTMAATRGITVDDKRLNALVTFHHDIRELPTMMFYFTASYSSGELQAPPWEESIGWVSWEEAYQRIPYPEMVYLMKAIRKQPDKLLGGAFRIVYEWEKRTDFEILEPLYPLR
ncbi:MAG: hypothetical protein AAF740_08335 [Bacteroidota bacterium]